MGWVFGRGVTTGEQERKIMKTPRRPLVGYKCRDPDKDTTVSDLIEMLRTLPHHYAVTYDSGNINIDPFFISVDDENKVVSLS